VWDAVPLADDPSPVSRIRLNALGRRSPQRRRRWDASPRVAMRPPIHPASLPRRAAESRARRDAATPKR